ncbi:SDR family oxidoreductase [Opitutales bacterium]|nr:SDR family oxidoreductase [Opitutales bacterium]
MNLGLKGRKILVTGSSRGIGFEIAQCFLKEGAVVGLVARGLDDLNFAQETLIRLFGEHNVFGWQCDVSDQNNVIELRQKIISEWGSLDSLVLNVGSGKSIIEPIPESDNWSKVWKANFDSSLNLCRESINHLLSSKQSSIVFISSICGIEALGAPTDYSVAKSALISFSKNLARKVAPQIRVNVVAPGNIYFPEGTWDLKIKENESKVKQMIDNEVPLKRFGKPDEVADAVVFLSSERASFITGATLIIDGGQTRSF